MDLYIWSLLLGAAGLGVMALSGLGARGGHAGVHGHAHGHAASHGSAAHTHAATGARTTRAAGSVRSGGPPSAAWRALSMIASPRFLFSFLLGVGTAGELLRPIASGPLQFAGAIVGGIVFERMVVSPLWNFVLRFASTPALTLESAVLDEATAVTAFDANGQGIVSLEVDGQIRQVLATLQPADRLLGATVRVGQRVRIEDVSAETNRCTVSVL